MRVLYVSTEVHPALKIGGLADVNAALPRALIELGVDVRLLLPQFPSIAQAARGSQEVLSPTTDLGVTKVAIQRASLASVPVYLIDAPQLYERTGNPYVDEHGRDWPDNHLRFALLGRIAARFAGGAIDAWRPDIVHAHDWHAGLAPAYLAARGENRPASVFTVHNLVYQGQFPADTFAALHLPDSFFATQGVEFHGGVNFMKAGLHYADRITTVSPTYAREIQKPAYGCGMDGLLRERSGALTGILNGVDSREWNPATDRRIAANFSAQNPQGKRECKAALRAELGLSPDSPGPVFGVVSRLTAQKGLDLVLESIPALIAGGGQLALLGSGDAELEMAFRTASVEHRGAVAVRIGYDEDLAHRVIAGADSILVPSRFEPCGLTQMYGMAYGSLPLVRNVGGLADTVRDADEQAIAKGIATGIVFTDASTVSFQGALTRALALWLEPARWDRVRDAAMREDHGWAPSARRYLELYREL